MFKKIALCAMLVLFLAPAAVMAAGQQGQEQGIGSEAGNRLNVQHQIAGDTTARDTFQNGQGQGSGSTMQNSSDARMLQTRSCDQTGEQDQDMARNMTRDRIQLNAESVNQQDGTAEPVQDRPGLTQGNGQDILASFADLLGARFRNMGEIFLMLGR